MKPSEAARARGITEILHFTTNRGLIGILSAGGVASRDRLDADPTLEAIKLPNVLSRHKDAAWTGYVNLSVSRVNISMLGYSKNWHQEDGVWWSVIAFNIGVIDDDSVMFTTTNNTWPVVKRAGGADGFEAMFASSVPYGRFGSIARRRATTLQSHTTCPQAEVLYPDFLSLDHAMHIYVAEAEHLDEVAGMAAAFPRTQDLTVTHAPEVFQ